jgi:hypothetical protein
MRQAQPTAVTGMCGCTIPDSDETGFYCSQLDDFAHGYVMDTPFHMSLKFTKLRSIGYDLYLIIRYLLLSSIKIIKKVCCLATHREEPVEP